MQGCRPPPSQRYAFWLVMVTHIDSWQKGMALGRAQLQEWFPAGRGIENTTVFVGPAYDRRAKLRRLTTAINPNRDRLYRMEVKKP